MRRTREGDARFIFLLLFNTTRAHGPRTPKHGGRYRKWTGAWPFSFFGASKACQNHAKYIVDVAELQSTVLGDGALYTAGTHTHLTSHYAESERKDHAAPRSSLRRQANNSPPWYKDTRPCVMLELEMNVQDTGIARFALSHACDFSRPFERVSRVLGPGWSLLPFLIYVARARARATATAMVTASASRARAWVTARAAAAASSRARAVSLVLPSRVLRR